MSIMRAVPAVVVGTLALLCLPAIASAGDALVDGPDALSRIPSSAKASFASSELQFQSWLAGDGAWSQNPLVVDAPHRVLWTTSHKQLRNDYCGPATMTVLDHFLRGSSGHWSQDSWAAYKYSGYPLWTDASGASMWVMAVGLREICGSGHSFSSGNTKSSVYSRTEYAIGKKGRPVAYGVRIYDAAWPYYNYYHDGHIMGGRGFDWRYGRIYTDDPYPENAAPPLGRGQGGGDTFGKRVYPKGVVSGGVVASDSQQVIY